MTDINITSAQLVRLEGEAQELGYASVADLLRAAGLPAKSLRNIRYGVSAREASAVIGRCQRGTVAAAPKPEPRPEPTARIDLSAVSTDELRAELARRGR